ncbi:MAG: sugar ABC transporter permease [Propionibacteriaceae bacterium]|nr:sugar ABC transporter permease [Propionibacteriaceae bacterium]
MSALAELQTQASARTRIPRAERRRLNAKKRWDNSGYLFLLPWMIGIAGLTVIPMASSLYFSLTKYPLLKGPTWIGVDNYIRLFADARVWTSFRVTFTYVIIGVPLQLAVALAIAVLLDRGMKGLSFYRSVLYLPSLLGGSVAIAVLWKAVFGADGVFNAFLALFGIHGMGWVSNPKTALGSIILLHCWTFGSAMVIFLAGLRNIPTMYYEAAEIDGAGPWKRFTSITMPLLTPIIFFNLVMQIIAAFQSFTQAYIVSGGNGGPADSTLFYALYLYKNAFSYFQMGYAAAMAWVLFLVIAAVTGINFWLSKYWVFYDA